MSLYIIKVKDKYIFYGGYKVKHIPKYHKFKWSPDNSYWYTYDKIIAHILLKCLLHPSECKHLDKWKLEQKLEQENKQNISFNIFYNWEQILLEEFNQIQLPNVKIVKPKQDIKELKITPHKRVITFD